MPNSSRRGYHPSAERWFNVIWVTNETAPPMSDQTMSALMMTDSEAAAVRTHLIAVSRRCRDRLPLKPVILADEADSRTSIAIALPAVPRGNGKATDRAPSRPGLSLEEEILFSALPRRSC